MRVGKYKKIDIRVKFSLVPENISFLSFYRHQCSPGALGNMKRAEEERQEEEESL